MSWRRFVHRDRWDDERARELRSYLDIETDENIARGMTSPDARAAAHRKLGNATLVREEIYRMNTIGFLDSLWQDLKYGLRLLRLNPGFACVAVLSLSLGVGANTAIFQLIDAVRVRTLPVHEPQDLVEVRLAERRGRTGSFTGRSPMLTNAIWERLRDDPDVFSGALAWTATPFDLSSGGEVRYADGLFVSGGFFPTLGVTPAAGRLLAPSDDQRDCAVPPAVISYPFWRREFGGDRSAIGRSVRVSGRSFEIAGVTPPGFFGVDVGRSYDVALPLCAEPLVRGEGSALTNPVGWFLAAFGRLKPGVSPEQATARLMAISPAIFLETTPPGYTAQQVAAYQKFSLAAFPAGSGVSTLRGTYQTPLWVPIGKAFQVEGGPGDPRPLYQIVGLVKDTKYQDVRDAFGPIAYVAAAQERDPGQYFQAIVRTSVPAEVLRVDIAQAVAAVNPSIAFHLDPIETLLRQALTPERLMATLSGFFGGLAGLIAAIGLYGVMSYTVTRRRNEIGIRMALGANRRAVVTMIVREGAALVAGGIVVGAALSFFAGRAAATLLFGLTPGDPETLALSIVALSAVAAAATWVPAARATRVDPSVVLRGE